MCVWCTVAVRFHRLWSFVLKVRIKQSSKRFWIGKPCAFQSLLCNRHTHPWHTPLHKHTHLAQPQIHNMSVSSRTENECALTVCVRAGNVTHAQHAHAHRHTKHKIHTQDTHKPFSKQRRVHVRSKKRKLPFHQKTAVSRAHEILTFSINHRASAKSSKSVEKNLRSCSVSRSSFLWW